MNMERLTTKWLSGARGAVVTVLLWVVGWGLGFGGLAELLVDPDGETLDVWLAEMVLPGFIAGVVFAVLVRIGEGRRNFAEVSLVRYTVWGLATGLVLGVLSASTGGPIPLEMSAAEMMGLATGLCLVAAVGSAVFFRLLVWRQNPGMAGRTG